MRKGKSVRAKIKRNVGDENWGCGVGEYNNFP
jgi:hypothetical protein